MSTIRYSEKLKSALDDLRPSFRDAGHSLEALTRKRKELAPTFHKTWLLWRRETHRPFVAFIQALEPTMPGERNAYRNHPAYRAAYYLKQLAGEPVQMKRRGVTPLAMLAMTIKSVLPLFNTQEKEDVLAALTGASRWRDRDITRLLAAVRKAKPVGLPKVPRLVEAAKAAKAAVLAFERKRVAA